jgi:hypothetical protein
MSKKIGYRILSTMVFTLAIVSIAVAHEVIITKGAKIGNGPELQPGTYQVEIVKNQDSAEVSFFKGGDLVVKVPAKLTQENTKVHHTEVHYEEANGAQMITLIRLKGSKEGLVFKPDTPKAE